MAYQAVCQDSGHRSSQHYSSKPSYPVLNHAGVVSKTTANGYRHHKENIYPDNHPSTHDALGPRNTLQYQQPTPEPSFQSPTSCIYSKPPSLPTPLMQTDAASVLTLPSKPKLPTPTPTGPPVDTAAVLMSLAEEYLAVAYGISSRSEDRSTQSGSREYYRLIATALACLETVLAKCRLQPEQEATVRLRYATVLFEETENEMEAEEALSKGISITERHRLFDLKYNMQHLLVRVLFQTRPAAAFRYLDGLLRDSQAYEHWPWLYAFNFLKISLHLELAVQSRQDNNIAFSTLNRLKDLAERNGDTAIVAIAATIKAWLALKTANTAESFEESQTSLALARGLQGSQGVQQVAQIPIMIALVDLCCCLQYFSPAQAQAKMKHVTDVLSNLPEVPDWLNNGSFNVYLQPTAGLYPQRESGVIRSCGDGRWSMLLNWLPKNDIYTMGYLLSGISLIHQSKAQSHKAEDMLDVGIKKATYDQQQSDIFPRSIIKRARLQLWRQQNSSYMRLHLAFVLCMRSEWDRALRHLNDFHDIAQAWSCMPASLDCLSRLLKATCLQGTGYVDDALILYDGLVNNESLDPSHIVQDISRIAALDSILILRNTPHPGHASTRALFDHLSTDCATHPNRQIQAAYHLVHSTLLESSTIIGRKQTLQSALNAAKASQSNTSLCIALSLMHWYFFRDQVNDQAEKSARAAQNMAGKVENNIWVSATAGILGDHLEAAGRPVEASSCFREGWKAAERLSDGIKSQLGWSDAKAAINVQVKEND